MRSKKPKIWNKTANIRSALRHVWRFSPLRIQALKNARIGRGSYLCKLCGGLFGPKEVQVDHIVTVTPPGFNGINWTEYVQRLFCEAYGLRVLCRQCHTNVTSEEKKQQKASNGKRKPESSDH